MTLGDSIFYSTLLLILAAAIHQISIRHKWKLVGKIVGALALIVGLVGGGLWWWWQGQRNLPQEVNELAGVKLGMTPVEVTLKLGKPDHVFDGFAQTPYSQIFVYDHPSLDVHFDRNQIPEVYRICEMAESDSDVLGTGWSTTEEQIASQLGPPTRESIYKDGLSKFASYDQFNVAYLIEKGRVAQLCVVVGELSFENEYVPPWMEKRSQ